ncbi:ABC-type amino acid transport substrate-binding protein [Chitinivorax tropicus]|uniref:ABC-type amino acid transport substrate-binding protein n=1 Tax=Chitinivorax tropicus TaxID=714531 RepID=A0A840MRK6_9PROT|nr:transporter substrate-binding domain-containing protein [Chitinivorax tropicus]MBB5017851.1 ABC-type amino acid transport substrate-binding protein [Chitinivorax tropicus]
MRRCVLCFILGLFPGLLIADTGPLEIVLGAEPTPPYAFEEKGEVRGFYRELLTEVLRGSGYQLRLQIIPPRRSKAMLLSGEIDGVVGVERNFPGVEQAVNSQPLLNINLHAITRSDTGLSYQSISDLEGRVIGAVAGLGLDLRFPNLHFEFVSDAELNLRKLIYKRFDVFLEDPTIVRYLASNKSQEYANRYLVLNPPIDRLDVVVVMNRLGRYTQAKLDALNRGLQQFRKQPKLAELKQRWALVEEPTRIARQGSLAVVVHPSSATHKLTEAQVAAVFLGKGLSGAFQPIDLPDEDPLREQFYLKIANLSPQQVKAQWARLVFSGMATTQPKVIKSSEEALMKVAERPGSIAYVDGSQVNDRVKVVYWVP